MQEISILLKSLHELEFLVAYHKQILTSNNKCSCSNLVCNFKEFYRVYINIKNLTQFLQSEILKLYAENCRLKEMNDQLTFNKLTYDAKRAAISMSNLAESSSLTTNKSFNLIKSNSNTTTIARAIEETESQLALRRQMPFNYLHNQINDHTEFDDLNASISVFNSNIRPKKIICSSTSSTSSFSSSGYSSQIPNTAATTITTTNSITNTRTNDITTSFTLRKSMVLLS